MSMKKNRAGKKKKRQTAPVTAADLWRGHKAVIIILAAALVLAVAAAVTAAYVRSQYEIKNIYVEGNVHHTDEEIVKMVTEGRFGHNSLYLSMKYRDKSIENVPFVQKMDVEIISKDSIRIRVYEKSIAGYVRYLGRYAYFDRDGIVVELSTVVTGDVPEVLGLSFDHVVLYQPLPVENPDIFHTILNLTQMLDKYQLKADRIYFDKNLNVYLYFDEVEVSIGTPELLDEKIIQLQYILPKLEGKKGVLEMKDYNGEAKHITFEEAEN